LRSIKFDAETSALQLQYTTAVEGVTEIVLPKKLRYAHGYDVSVHPSGVLSVKDTVYGVELVASTSQSVTVDIIATPSALV